MIPQFGNVETQLTLWMIAMIRPGAAFLVAPVFANSSVPVQLRLVLAAAIGIPAAAAVQLVVPQSGVLSVEGILMLMAEVLAGLAIGFALQIGFAAAQVAGEVISNAMGLGFAAMTNPMGGQASPAVGQFLALLATFLFLATDGHLALASILVDSYRALPPGAWLSANAIGGLLQFGSLVFSAGLVIALPVGFALILVQIIMGLVARSAPTLNLFSVGLPATLLAGIILLAIGTPVMADSIQDVLSQALITAGRTAG